MEEDEVDDEDADDDDVIFERIHHVSTQAVFPIPWRRPGNYS